MDAFSTAVGHYARDAQDLSADRIPIPARGKRGQKRSDSHVTGASLQSCSKERSDGHDFVATHWENAIGEQSPQGGDEATFSAMPSGGMPRLNSSASDGGAPGQPQSDTLYRCARRKQSAKAGDEAKVRAITNEQTPRSENVASATIDGGQFVDDDHWDIAPVDSIIDQWRLRQDLVRARIKLELQCQAIIRRYNPDADLEECGKIWGQLKSGKHADVRLAVMCLPYFEAMKPLNFDCDKIEKGLVKMAKAHPLYAWTKDVRGFGELSLAGFIGECGRNPEEYRSPAALWKRFGLAVIDGERQRKCANAEKAIQHAYSPQRRSWAFVLSTCLLRSQGSDGPYRLIYDERKAYELANGQTKLVAHLRAQRYMLKRLLKHAWQASRREAVT